uniref:ST3 beta-galactoside alpha-2,3-sialyltransferase 1 n=1 Tax=Neogobius melanostomus TaxID=47308 RepID=A0A8C6UNN0_9GOBI
MAERGPPHRNCASPLRFCISQRMQGERRNMTFFKKTTQEIFEMFPAFPPVPKPGVDGCTCAVVGNSINLKGSHYGKLIDFHDFVFRMNRGKTQGFEEDVGTRTTHRAMYPESAMNIDNSTYLVLFPFKIWDLQWLVKAFTNIKLKNGPSKQSVMVVHPAFMKYVHESWLEGAGRYPSTGCMVVILALHLCDEVSLFGFGADSDGNWSHYWETLMNKRLHTGPHPGSVEYDMILKLAKHGRVDFYSGR